MTVLDDNGIAMKTESYIPHTANVSGDSSSLPALPNLPAGDKGINTNENMILYKQSNVYVLFLIKQIIVICKDIYDHIHCTGV
jgi:hypothetical protein